MPDTFLLPAPSTSQTRAQRPRASSVALPDGHSLFLRDWGEGPAILFLSGWAMDSTIWGPTMTALNDQGFRTIAYDRRGHGRSTDPGGCDYDQLADDLDRVLTALDLNEVTVVAHSGAGGEVIRYVTRHGRARLARIVLLGAVGPCMRRRPDNPLGHPDEAVETLLQQLSSDLPAWIDANDEPFAPGAARRTLDWLAAMVMNTSHRAALDFQRAIVDADLRAEAAALRLPVSLIHGDRDVSAPLELTAHRYAELIPNAELIVYPGVAHGVMVTHAPRLAEDIGRIARNRRGAA